MDPDEDIWIAGIALPPSKGIKNEMNDFTHDEISRMNLVDLPITAFHNPKLNLGRIVASPTGESGKKYIIAKLNMRDPVNRLIYENEIKGKKVLDFSTTNKFLAIPNPKNPSQLFTLKQVLDVSMTGKGNRDGCPILVTATDSELKSVLNRYIFNQDRNTSITRQDPSPDTVIITKTMNPPAIVENTNSVPAQEKAIPPQAQLPPQDLASLLANPSEDELRKQSQDDLTKLAMALLKNQAENSKREKEFAEREARYKQYEQEMEKKRQQEAEQIRSGIYEGLGKVGINVDQIKPDLENVFSGKTLDQLQTENRVFTAVLQNSSHLWQQNQELQAKLEKYKRQNKMKEELDPSNYNYAQSLTRAIELQSHPRFHPYDVANAERPAQQQPPVANAVAPTQTPPVAQAPPATQQPPKNGQQKEINYPLPPPGTTLAKMAQQDPIWYHNLQTQAEEPYNPSFLDSLANAFYNTPGTSNNIKIAGSGGRKLY
jgi:hypothetical protein